MFKFLKEKLKQAITRFSSKVEETVEEKPAEEKETEIKEELPEQIEEKTVEKEETKTEEVVEEKEKTEEEIEKKEEPEKEATEEKVESIETEKKTTIDKNVPSGQVTPASREIIKTKKEMPRTSLRTPPRNISEAKEGKKKAELEIKKEKETKKVEEEPKGIFARVKETVLTKKITEEKFSELFWDFEVELLEKNVAVEVIDKIKQDLKKELVEKPVSRIGIAETVQQTLKKTVSELFIEPPDILEKVRSKKPFVICFFGINGSGKTTTIAKLAHYLQKQNLTVVIAAADTFRAAAIDQLQKHAETIGVKVVAHEYGSDPAAVAFDAIKHAQAAKKDVVLVDTAGRMHSNANLMDEMKKIVRVAKPDLKVFVGESITGNDCVEQAKTFNEAVGIDGIILAKADVDEKGGAALSVSYVTRKPILFFGTGQTYDDLEPFDLEKVMASVGI